MKEQEKNYSFADFRKAIGDMTAKSTSSFSEWDWGRKSHSPTREYSKTDIERIVDSGSVDDQIALSRNYFYRDGFYRRIIIYYATLLCYTGLVIPEVNQTSKTVSITDSSIIKRYNNAISFVDDNKLPELFTRIALIALRDGTYYGIINNADSKGTLNKKNLSILDLPSRYCTSRFKDKFGNDVIEFDVTYFNTLDTDSKKKALKAYPKVISSWYYKYTNDRVKSKWVYIPTDIGLCFPFIDDGRPMFLNILPACIDYDEAVATERERDKDEIRKIVTQEIPHLNDGQLLFEPEEAAEMHKGLSKMLSGNKNVSVVTSYGNIEVSSSDSYSQNQNNSLTKMLDNIYSQGGVSKLLFSSDSNLALTVAIQNDMAMMMIIARKLESKITVILNSLFGNSNVHFRYMILPITWYNREDFIDSSFKLASSGYSLLLPALAMGISQKELGNLKDLENDVLDLTSKLQPLKSSFTQSSDSDGNISTSEPGRPEKKDKSDKTLANIAAQDKGGTTDEN